MHVRNRVAYRTIIVKRVLALAGLLLLGSLNAAGREIGVQTPTPGGASDAFSGLMDQGRTCEGRLDPGGALRCYLKAAGLRPDDPQVLVKIAKEYSDLTLLSSDEQENRRLMGKALEYSLRATELEPHDAVALLSVAVCYGKLGLYGNTREKIEKARLVRDFAERAVAADPGYAFSHHVLGQWDYEVASLGRTKRFFIDVLYGGLPAASTDDAVRELERAVELEPEAMCHHLALGFAYRANADPLKARAQFERVLSMPCREIYDADCRRQAAEALRGLGS